MNGYQHILDKLEDFTKRFYTKELIKGLFLFLSLGTIFWFVVVGFEYWLWLDNAWRMVLFCVFILVELYLLYRYIVVPLLYLFKIRNGIDTKDASKLIGSHFPEVGDKLYNLLELSDNNEKTELLLASIDQRAEQLKPVPFTKAVDYRESYRYAKYVVIPLMLLVFIWSWQLARGKALSPA